MNHTTTPSRVSPPALRRVFHGRESEAALPRCLRNIGVSLSQMLNAVLGGDPDMTLSARAGMATSGQFRWLAVALDFIDPGHTRDSHAADPEEGGDAL